MVKDINSGSDESDLSNLIAIGSTVYFSANDGTNGTELWKSDGSPEGTVILKDIRSGSGSSSPSNLIAVGNTLYFSANDGTNGTELWKSDGSPEGTVMLKDINSGSGSSSPSNLTTVESNFFFSADDGSNGAELWKSDGSAEGTVMLKDINSGPSSSSPSVLTLAGGALLFSASTATLARQLWVLNLSSPAAIGNTRLSAPTAATDPTTKIIRLKKLPANRISLTQKLRKEVRAAVRSLSSVSVVVCTGYASRTKVNGYTKKLARERADRVCKVAKKVASNAQIRTRVVVVGNKVAKLRSVRVAITGG
jgi:ELWxxDGT repeat protein